MDSQRIIIILEYLGKHTDDSRGVTIADIQEHLAAHDMLSVSPLTIRRDIDRLSGMGYDIRRENGAHNTAYYRLYGKGFTFNEIRFIVDSVSINKFLSPRQKRRLIKKFEGMCSDSELRRLVSRVTIETASPPSLDLLDNLDKIHTLISEKRKINFSYGKKDTHNQMKYYDKRRDMLPVRVVYFNERFYLRCFDEANGNFRTYRVDRMSRITGGEASKKKPPKEEKYNGFVADMFPPERFETVIMRVRRYLLDEMLEQLGSFASVRDDFDDPDHVIVRACCGINRQFYLWVMRYGDGIEIMSPESVRTGFLQELKKILKNYSEV